MSVSKALRAALGGTASGEHGIGGLKLSALLNETPERILKNSERN